MLFSLYHVNDYATIDNTVVSIMRLKNDMIR